jgi:hypothetical protein
LHICLVDAKSINRDRKRLLELFPKAQQSFCETESD